MYSEKVVDISFTLEVHKVCWPIGKNFGIYFLFNSFRVPLDQLQEVFHHKPGFRKILLATNIAESSITIPDVEVVIDFCLAKNLVCDPKTNVLKLKMEWIDGNNALQVSYLPQNNFFFIFFNVGKASELNKVGWSWRPLGF